jgi:hypothetical protein
MAVREGFEPSIRCRIHAFQACSFDHSDTSPIEAQILLVSMPKSNAFFLYLSRYSNH